MLFRLFLLFIIVPLVELALLLWMGGLTQWWVPLMIVIVTGMVGATLAKWQGWQTYQRIQRELSQGQMPGDAVLDAVLIFVAGALLLTPGMLTDVVGLSLLLPLGRRFYKDRMVKWFKSKFTLVDFAASDPANGEQSEVIDSYVVDRSEEEGDETP